MISDFSVKKSEDRTVTSPACQFTRNTWLIPQSCSESKLLTHWLNFTKLNPRQICYNCSVLKRVKREKRLKTVNKKTKKKKWTINRNNTVSVLPPRWRSWSADWPERTPAAESEEDLNPPPSPDDRRSSESRPDLGDDRSDSDTQEHIGLFLIMMNTASFFN